MNNKPTNTPSSSVVVSRGSVVVLRVLLSGIFLMAGINHLLKTDKTVSRIEHANFKGIAYFFGDPELLVILSGIIMLIAGTAFMTGIKTRWAAAVLVAVLIPITLTVQVGQVNTLGPLFKNIAILGGLLFFVFNQEIKTNKDE